jgi:hypothetical protein
MSEQPTKSQRRDYEVGYRKPPVHSRFRKGQSGNPRGGSRRAKSRRLEEIILKEAFRPIRIREGDHIERIPTIEAILRGLFTHAAKGNGPAQRFSIEMLRASQQVLVAQALAEAKQNASERPLSELEVARRIAFILNKVAREQITLDTTHQQGREV